MFDLFCQWANYLGDDYEVEIPEESPIEIPQDSSGSYEFTPSFEAETEFDLYYYDTTIAQAKKLIKDIETCELSRETGETYTEEKTITDSITGMDEVIEILFKNQEIDLTKCLDIHMPENWELDCEGKDEDYTDDTFMFCVPLPYELKIYNEETNKVEEINPSIKFAIEFERKELEPISNECEGIKGGYSYTCLPANICSGDIDNTMVGCGEDYVCCKIEATIEKGTLLCSDIDGYECKSSCSQGKVYPGAVCLGAPMYPLVCCLYREDNH